MSALVDPYILGAPATTETFTATDVFTVPTYTTLVVELFGAGGGGAANDGYLVPTISTDGGDTTFEGQTAGGGQRAVSATEEGPTSPGTGGTATGGDINTSGGNGTAATFAYQSSGGGDCPNGGTGAPPVYYSQKGLSGSAPGGGGGGAGFGSGAGSSSGGDAGGGGAYCKKTYGPGDLTPGAELDVVIGAPGAGALTSNAYANGGNGARGEARITYT